MKIAGHRREQSILCHVGRKQVTQEEAQLEGLAGRQQSK